MEIGGWITDYCEFGMEGRALVFQDEAYCNSSGWEREGMHWLADGDVLTILNEDGSVLWHGTLPSDVDRDVWWGWFEKNPPMRAILTPSPAFRNHQYGMAEELVKIGDLERTSGEPASARTAYSKAIEIWETLVRVNRTDTTCQLCISSTLLKLGLAEWDSEQLAAARTAFSRAIEIMEAHGKTNPTDTNYEHNKALGLYLLGLMEQAFGQAAPARTAFSRAIEIWESQQKVKPTDTRCAEWMATALVMLGALEYALGRLDIARTTHNRAIEICEALAKANPTVNDYQKTLASALLNLGNVEKDTGQSEVARKAYLRSIAICEEIVKTAPKDDDILLTLGAAQYRVGNYAEATETLTKSLHQNKVGVEESEPPIELVFLVMTYWQLGLKAEAQATFQRLQEVMKRPRNINDIETQKFLSEATELICQ